jgi:hypothetical protein
VLQQIQECFKSNSVFYSRHAKTEMVEEEFGRIFEHEVFEAVCDGEVIEDYPYDRPYPSVLILGRTRASRPLHMVCAYNEEENLAIVVTVYHPNPDLWIEYRVRRKL